MVSRLNPDECRMRLKKAPTSRLTVARLWFAGGDAGFYKGGVGAIKAGSLLEMHVRIEVSPGERNSSRLHLRFSGGFGGSVLMPLLAVCCLAAFGWAVRNLTAGAAWDPLNGAALLSISVPGLLVLAMRSDAPNDQKVLWEFVADQVDGGSGATPG